jgi:hypothetical protein
VAREAVMHLADTSARLELAKAQLALGDGLAAGGFAQAARREWATAAGLAGASGAAALERRATEARM